MMVNILAGGSGGNCIAVRSGNITILIDAGIPAAKIERHLLDAGIRPDEIAGIFITHAHKDHVKGLPLANKYHIPVYAAEGEWKDIHGVDEYLQCTLVPSKPHYVRRFVVTPFETHHDAYEPLGLAIEVDGKKVSICLDTGLVDDEMLDAMQGSDIIVMEANHDPDMLAASDYPDSVRERILSDRGHLSNQQAAEALSRLVQGRGERVYLTHLSRKNNLPALARMTVEQALKRKGFKNGTHYHLEVV
ncbi:MAG: MBL fold metallo-hydrolase [Bacillus thermozeamaize]|uniref:MBL fold metallo-hydrolase n=1 Tax=Bacillus thermozeamaize TaxID=230954 RepID=A0A1Y3PMY8_9BACI|nr:MAG: MBL fold metallo-hydrolase [Bacillus thermozeamaize]